MSHPSTTVAARFIEVDIPSRGKAADAYKMSTHKIGQGYHGWKTATCEGCGRRIPNVGEPMIS